ncbi:hypothetical protein DUNSADRAFT_2408 [Dunaliella salina]|uniref:C2H2-type domain-containing protein n=1 Tax=Dunaliella salina TaxID=3046 RepID=A0ABQ7FWB4_DUNSA|nr:hypothetical protein DUNSADRAFT_2408 [Dunaliella salina]|eukprot:KAF5826660.1 hypothetical protein DUNSADRAFT_2408 [Dunaliella salina]
MDNALVQGHRNYSNILYKAYDPDGQEWWKCRICGTSMRMKYHSATRHAQTFHARDIIQGGTRTRPVQRSDQATLAARSMVAHLDRSRERSATGQRQGTHGENGSTSSSSSLETSRSGSGDDLPVVHTVSYMYEEMLNGVQECSGGEDLEDGVHSARARDNMDMEGLGQDLGAGFEDENGGVDMQGGEEIMEEGLHPQDGPDDIEVEEGGTRSESEDWDELESSDSGEEGSDVSDDDTDTNARPGTGRYYRERLKDPVFEGCKINVLQLVFFFLTWRSRSRLSRKNMNDLLRFLSLLMPSGSFFPSSIAQMKSCFSIEDWRKYERHVCARDHCEGHYWGYLPREEWGNHEEDACPKCDGSRFKEVIHSGKRCLEPVTWYIDFLVEKVIKENFLKSPAFVKAYESSTPDLAPGSWQASPEYNRQKEAFDAAREPIGGGFDDKSTGHYELMTDAGQPYNSVQHSTNLGSLRCSSLSPMLKCQSFNMHPIFIVPGPTQPSNQRPFLLRTLNAFRKYGLKSEGIKLEAASPYSTTQAVPEDNGGGSSSDIQHHRIVMTD